MTDPKKQDTLNHLTVEQFYDIHFYGISGERVPSADKMHPDPMRCECLNWAADPIEFHGGHHKQCPMGNIPHALSWVAEVAGQSDSMKVVHACMTAMREALEAISQVPCPRADLYKRNGCEGADLCPSCRATQMLRWIPKTK